MKAVTGMGRGSAARKCGPQAGILLLPKNILHRRGKKHCFCKDISL